MGPVKVNVFKVGANVHNVRAGWYIGVAQLEMGPFANEQDGWLILKDSATRHLLAIAEAATAPDAS